MSAGCGRGHGREPKSLSGKLQKCDTAGLDRVYFNAYTSGRISCFNCPVNYHAVTADTHSALDISTGKFTCPSAGHYLFQFHALAETGSEAQVRKTSLHA